MADLSINAANVLASANAVIEKSYNFGATVTAGQLVYLDSNNRWVLNDANAAATGNGVTDTRGVALCNGSNGQPAAVCKEDIYFKPGATLTNGAAYYGSPNAGALAAAADITTGNYPVFVGLARDTTYLHLKPIAAGVAV